MPSRSIIVAGAGILGLWQALVLARQGHRVRLLERSAVPAAAAASRWAGAMLAPDCEAEAAPAVVRDQGHAGLALWREVYPHLVERGSLVVAAPRDRADLKQFASRTANHRAVDGRDIAVLEPDLADRFPAGLFFEREAHMATPDAMAFLLAAARDAGVVVETGVAWHGEVQDVAIDCRGYEARRDVAGLRGVRGERVLVRAADVRLTRPVRLLHPRHPLYVVPWQDGRYVIGATVVESEDEGPMTVRSALEMLGTAYALHPGFAEAEILDMGAGVRPAFADNVPRAIVEAGGRVVRVNGAYRHGFLLAPVLAQAVAGYLAGDVRHPLLATA